MRLQNSVIRANGCNTLGVCIQILDLKGAEPIASLKQHFHYDGTKQSSLR